VARLLHGSAAEALDRLSGDPLEPSEALVPSTGVRTGMFVLDSGFGVVLSLAVRTRVPLRRHKSPFRGDSLSAKCASTVYGFGCDASKSSGDQLSRGGWQPPRGK